MMVNIPSLVESLEPMYHLGVEIQDIHESYDELGYLHLIVKVTVPRYIQMLNDEYSGTYSTEHLLNLLFVRIHEIIERKDILVELNYEYSEYQFVFSEQPPTIS